MSGPRRAPRGASIADKLAAMSMPEPNSGCHLWLAALTPKGYGLVSINGEFGYAHRFAYMDQVGDIPKGMHIDHLCRNRSCINVRHLEVVTPRENTRRGILARKTHCLRGHPFSDENTIRSNAGRRICCACRREYVEAQRQKRIQVRRTPGQFSSKISTALSKQQTDWLEDQAARRTQSVSAVLRELVQAAMNAAAAKTQEGAA